MELVDHWRVTAPNWADRRERLAWHLVFDDAPQLAERAAALGPALEAAGLDVVPPRWLHLTLCDADGPVELADVEPFRIELGPPRLLSTAVVLAASPAGALATLRDTLVGERDPGFDPHLTLAYVNRELDADMLVPTLRDLDPLPVVVDVDSVALVRLRRDDRGYTWDVVERRAL